MFRRAFACLLVCAAATAQQQERLFQLRDVLAALEDKTGPVPGREQAFHRVERLVSGLVERENPAMGGDGGMVGGTHREQILFVQADKQVIDVVRSLFDEMRREPLPRFHLACTVLVMPSRVAVVNGLVTPRVEDADPVSMTRLMRDVVKVKGTLLNLPEVIATPLVPFVAEPRIGVDGKPPPPDVANLRLRGEAVALGPEEALFSVQFVRGSLPEDRTVLPKSPVFDRGFRRRVGAGVTITAKDDKLATVWWLRFTGISTGAPKAKKLVDNLVR